MHQSFPLFKSWAIMEIRRNNNKTSEKDNNKMHSFLQQSHNTENWSVNIHYQETELFSLPSQCTLLS